MALTVDFKSPKTATTQVVNVSGTVPAGLTFVQTLQLDVLRAGATHEYFSLTVEYTAGATDLVLTDDPVYMAIVPKLNTTGTTPDTVTLSSSGSLKAQILLAVNS